MGIDDEDQIWKILTSNPFAMTKLEKNANAGTMVLSDILTEWELGIGRLQSQIIRRVKDHFNADNKGKKEAPKEENKDPEPSEPSDPSADLQQDQDADKKDDQ